MNITKPFENGILGLLAAEWTLQLKTPLIIRNGNKAALKIKPDDSEASKGRGLNLEMYWQGAAQLLDKPSQSKKYAEVMDFNYHFSINSGNVQVSYGIPASSIRGALRNNSIKRWVELENRDAFSLKKKEEMTKEEIKAKFQNAKSQLEERKNGWYNILSLFGSAFDTESPEETSLIWSGRLRLETMIDTDSPATNTVTYSGEPIKADDIPSNISLTISNLGPVDAVTMGAKRGGLHYWLEMNEGQNFKIHFKILNPNQNDLKLLELWQDEINEGFLLFGAGCGEDNGRAKIKEQKYKFFISKASRLYEQLKNMPNISLNENDVLEDIWLGVELSWEQLKTLKLEQLQKSKGETEDEQ